MAQALMGTLDRYLLKRSAIATLLILSLALCIGIFLDLVLNLERYYKSDVAADSERWKLILQLYCYRMPLIISSIFPYALVAGCLVCIAPMLKRGEWTATLAGGLSPQRIALPFCALAIVGGLFVVLCNNVITPQLHQEVQSIEMVFFDDKQRPKIWHLKDTEATWYAAHSALPDSTAPKFRKVFIAAKDGGCLYADSMKWNGQEWKLNGSIIEWKHPTQKKVVQHDNFKLIGPYALSLSPTELRQELLTRDAFTAAELWKRGDHMYMTLLLNRLMAFFIPLFALFYALPTFARFENQQKILVAASKSIVYASIPVIIIAFTGMAADASSWSPWLTNALGGICAAIPGAFLYSRWTSA